MASTAALPGVPPVVAVDRGSGVRGLQHARAHSQRVDPERHLADAGDGWPVGAEGADRELAGTVDGQLGQDPAEQPGELAGMSCPDTDQHPRRAGYVVGDEVAVWREVVAADTGVELRPESARQVALQER